MKQLINWIKSLFSNNTKQELFQEDIPSGDYEYNELMIKREKELDRILFKIQKHGIETLSKEEHKFLKKMKK